jgi:hypothetical protein
VHFKRFAYERGLLRINEDGFCGVIIEISKRSKLRPEAVLELLADATANILRELVDIILANPEFDCQGKLPLRRWIETKARKQEFADFSGVDKPNDSPAIE